MGFFGQLIENGMEQDLRNKRLRAVVKQLNAERKRHAMKVDILCNDLVESQKQFISRLNTIDFSSGFYESIIGATELDKLFNQAAGMIESQVFGAEVAFFLRKNNRIDIYPNRDWGNVSEEFRDIKNRMNLSLANRICNANKVCGLEEIFAMDVDGCPEGAGKLSAAAFPIGMVKACGFMLVSRDGDNPLDSGEIANIAAITGGLSKAVESCQMLACR